MDVIAQDLSAGWGSRTPGRKAMSTAAQLALAASLLLIFSSCARQATIPAEHGEWPMYQFAPTHNAVIVHEGPPVSWAYDSGARINGGLAIVNDEVIFGNFDHKVVSLNVRTGRPLWIRSTDNVVMSTPVVRAGIIIVGTGRNGSLGAPQGSYAYDPRINNGSNEIWGRLEGDHILAFELSSGKTLWRYRTAGEDMPSAMLTSGMVIFANGDRHAYAVDIAHGRPIWRTELHGVSTMASANTADGLALVSACNLAAGWNETTALNIEGGGIHWRVAFGNCDAAPTIWRNRVFLSDEVRAKTLPGAAGHATVECLDLQTGQRLWRYSDDPDGLFTSVGSNERAITGTFANGEYLQPMPASDTMVAFSPEGRVRWRFKSVAPIKMSPVVVHNRVIVGDTAGLLYELDARSGHLISARMFQEGFSTSPPVVFGHSVIVASGNVLRALPI